MQGAMTILGGRSAGGRQPLRGARRFRVRALAVEASSIGAHDPAETSRRRRDEPATPGCVPRPPVYPTAVTGTQNPFAGRVVDPGEPMQGAMTDPRRPVRRGSATPTRRPPVPCACPGGRGLFRRGTRPGGNIPAAPRRASDAGVRARPLIVATAWPLRVSTSRIVPGDRRRCNLQPAPVA